MNRVAAVAALLLCLVLQQVSAQTNAHLSPNNLPYRNLVLEGGGIRGIAYGGALAELEKQNILSQITRVAGTSAGAVQAALLAVGYTPAEIADITARTPVKKFNDGRLIFFGGFSRLFAKYGWYRGEHFSKWVGELIAAKTGNPNLTFAELHQRHDTLRFKDLYVVGTNLTMQRAEVFSHETHPGMRIRDAVRISMSIPLYFRAVLLDTDGNIVKKPEKGQPVHVLVDGGIVANFPIHLFDQVQYLPGIPDPPITGPVFNEQTLGIRLDLPGQIEYDRRGEGLAPYPIDNFGSYMGAFYNIVIENLNRQQLQPRDWERTISVSTAGFGPRIRRLSASDKQKLWESGQAGALHFFGRNP